MTGRTLTAAVTEDLVAALLFAPRWHGRSVDELTAALYAAWYCRPGTVASAGRGGRPSPPLVSRLRAAHAGTARFSAGWVVQGVLRDGAVLATRGAEERVVEPGAFARLDRPGAPPGPGSAVAISTRIDTVDAPSGYWAAQAGAEPPAGPLVRAYWNCDGTTAPAVVRALTEALLDAGVDWSLKAPLAPAGYQRADAVVAYLPVADVDAAAPAFGAAYRRIGHLLLAPTPRLAWRAAPGLAFAEDPANGESFGTHRCRAVATGLVRAAGRHDDRAVMLGELRAALVSFGIDPRRPHRNAVASAAHLELELVR
jgi:hypothetical protein